MASIEAIAGNIKKLQTLTLRLDDLRSNLTKLNKDKRTKATVERLFHSAGIIWRDVQRIDASLRSEPDRPPDYEDKFLKPKATFDKIKEFVANHFPGMENQILEEELSDINQQIDDLFNSQQARFNDLQIIIKNMQALPLQSQTAEAFVSANSRADRIMEEILSTHEQLGKMNLANVTTDDYMADKIRADEDLKLLKGLSSSIFPTLFQPSISVNKESPKKKTAPPPPPAPAPPTPYFDVQDNLAENAVKSGELIPTNMQQRKIPQLTLPSSINHDEMFSFPSTGAVPKHHENNRGNILFNRNEKTLLGEKFPNHSSSVDPETSNGSLPAQFYSLMEMLARNQQTLTENQRNESPQQSTGRGFKIPEIQLPNFSGNVIDYKAFKETFNSIVERSNTTPIERFTFLRSKLAGAALATVSNIGLTSGNYQNAWELLDQRFDNPRLVIESNLRLLIDSPTIAEDPRDILRCIQMYQSVTRNLDDQRVNWKETCVVYHVMRSMKPRMLGRLENSMGRCNVFPSLDQIGDFLEQEYAIGMRLHSQLGKELVPFQAQNQNVRHEQNHRKPIRTFVAQSVPEKNSEPGKRDSKCFICSEHHTTLDCPKFLAAEDRVELLREHKLCMFCVKHRYDYRKPCRGRAFLSCEICQGQHVTPMHPKVNVNEKSSAQLITFTNLTQNQAAAASSVILPTAIVNICAPNGNILPVRCLIDQCSQSSYITEELVQQLRIKKHKTSIQISGVGGLVGSVQSLVTLTIAVDDQNLPPIKFKALVVKKVTGKLPSYPCHIDWAVSDIPLADPEFQKPAMIPILLGSNVLQEIFCTDGEVVMKKNGLLLQKTIFGWIASGKTTESISKFTSTHITLSEMENQLHSFWDLPVTGEEAASEQKTDDEYCEQLFNELHTRMADGRYVVPIPWKREAPELGNSYRKAVRFFIAQEHRMQRNEHLKEMSNAFMQEYVDMEHMTLIPRAEQRVENGSAYYIPWMSVVRENADTTKLRNVFNASSASSNGISLNDLIHPGPKLQTHIFDIITSMRQFEYFYTTDVTKMFRQILATPEDRNKLRIIWRPNQSCPLQEYRLNTVTYGLDCAPWQAIRTVHQIAKDNAPDTETRDILMGSTYVDDVCHGAESILKCKEQIVKIDKTFAAGQLPLSKWAANHPAILENVPEDKKLTTIADAGKPMKTLGLTFDPTDDCYVISVKEHTKPTFTKRGLLSIAASLYDPIGWILPVIMMLRILLQSLWQQGYDWDDELDETTKNKFLRCISQLPVLGMVRVPRWTGPWKSSKLELIGFSDASGDGFAAVIYSRVKTSIGYQIRLIASRGRVTPLKTKINVESKLCTIPKMELEALSLLIDLYHSVKKCFHDIPSTFIAFTDSEIVLAWIRSQRIVDNKFVKRRVEKIRKSINPADVHYVKSHENPADPASRGVNPEKFILNDLWFKGPNWLQDQVLPLTPYKDHTVTLVATVHEKLHNFIEEFSTYNLLIRTVAQMLRWKTHHGLPKNSKISAAEVTVAIQRILLYQQRILFSSEINKLNAKKFLPKRHWISALHPFISEDGLMRVGGRLSRAMIPYEQRHPILLTKCFLLDLIIRHLHQKTGHSGLALTERLIRETYWIPSVRTRVKKIIRSCTTCIRWQARTIKPLMGDLPLARVNPAPIFSQVGVDLCGFFLIKASKLRNAPLVKVWVAVYVCLISKAVHLEICSDLSTEKFLACFSRFTSRRCTPSLVMSDNGTNFIGAARQFKEAWQRIQQESKDTLATQEISWEFIPPFSPTFGGLWEAAVKSMKHFAHRMESTDKLQYEDFDTLLKRIESFLNSRPLYPDPSDPESFPALTPFHLINQRGFKNSPTDVAPKKIPITRQWLQIQETQRLFWEQFQEEYLCHLQKRYKWKNPTRNMEIGDLVLMIEPNTTPGDWKMGRIVETYPDKAGSVREVDVKTAGKEAIHRATNKLVPLLAQDDDKEPEIALRRSQRNRPPQAGLLTRVLLSWISLTAAANSLVIQSLSPGVHIYKLGEVSIKAFDLSFSITTSINVTSDLALIGDQAEKFEQYCLSLKNSPYASLFDHCNSYVKAIKAEETLVHREILTSYSHKIRQQRSIIPHVLKVIGKGVVKYTPHIAVAGAITYQEIRSDRINGSVFDLQGHVVTIASIMANKSEIFYEQTGSALAAVKRQQEQILEEGQITDFATALQILMSSMQEKHQNVERIRPLTELKTYVADINDKIKTFALPSFDDPNDIFTFNKIVKRVVNHMVTLDFLIPIVSTKQFTEFGIVSVPDENDEAVLMEEGVLIQRIAVDRDNQTFFDASSNLLSHNIYEKVLATPISRCTRRILQNNSTTTIEEACKRHNDNKPFEQTILWREDLAVIFATPSSQIRIDCEDLEQRTWSRVSLVSFPNCTITSATSVAAALRQSSARLKTQNEELPEFESITPPSIIIAEQTDDPRLASLDKDLRAELAHPETWLNTDWKFSDIIDRLFQHGHHALILGAIILFLAIYIYTRSRQRSSERRNRVVNDILTARDRLPDSWLEDVHQWHRTRSV